MRVRNLLLLLGASVWTMALVLMAGMPTSAQAPAGRGNAAAVPAAQVHGNLAQVMRGILYPASNVVFTSGGPIACAVAHCLQLPPAVAIELLWLREDTGVLVTHLQEALRPGISRHDRRENPYFSAIRRR